MKGHKIVVVGGCGHVGLPLGVKFALAQAEVVLLDVSRQAIQSVNSGRFPFLERGGEEQLQQALRNGLTATADPEACRGARTLVFVTGTPVDEHLNPRISDVLQVWDTYAPYIDPETCVVMRSTLFPGTMEHLKNRLGHTASSLHLAFCPERVAQGLALEEIEALPQIVAAFDDESFARAYEVFRWIAPEVVRLQPLEAELAKLMANSWRYLEFAIANQFYLIAEENGVDFHRLYQAIRYKYPRAQGYKAAGFAAGPCLFKDTMQLASFFKNQFYMGHSAMLVNEGMADHAVRKTIQLAGGSLWGKTVGILGLAFKANSDDTRDSLSFRVRKGLQFHGANVLCHDPYLETDCTLERLADLCDFFVLCAPHREYSGWPFRSRTVDVWNFVEPTELEILPGRAMKAEVQVS